MTDRKTEDIMNKFFRLISKMGDIILMYTALMFGLPYFAYSVGDSGLRRALMFPGSGAVLAVSVVTVVIVFIFESASASDKFIIKPGVTPKLLAAAKFFLLFFVYIFFCMVIVSFFDGLLNDNVIGILILAVAFMIHCIVNGENSLPGLLSRMKPEKVVAADSTVTSSDSTVTSSDSIDTSAEQGTNKKISRVSSAGAKVASFIGTLTSAAFDIFIFGTAAVIAKPYMADGISGNIGDFFDDLEESSVYIFTFIVVALFYSADKLLTAKKPVSAPYEEINFDSGIFTLIKTIFKLAIGIFIGCFAVSLTEYDGVSKCVGAAGIIFAAFFIQWVLRKEYSFFSRISSIIWDMRISGEIICDKVMMWIEDTIGIHIFIAIAEALFLLVPLAVMYKFKDGIIPVIFSEGNKYGYCFMSIFASLGIDELFISRGVQPQSFLFADIGEGIYTFFSILPVCCILGGLFCWLTKTGYISKWVRNTLTDFNDRVMSIKSKYAEYDIGDGKRVKLDISGKTELFFIFCVAYILALVLYILFYSLLLPLRIAVHFAIGLITLFLRFRSDEDTAE